MMDKQTSHNKAQIPQELQDRLERVCRGDLEGHIFFTARKAKVFSINVLKEFNIGFEQVGVLHILKIAGGLNINQLALIMHKDRGTVSRCVESLCKKNYVKKIRHADDKRIFLASLTSDGEAFLDMLFIHFQRISTPLSKILSQDKVQSFHTLLDKVCRHYDSVISQIQKSIKNHD